MALPLPGRSVRNRDKVINLYINERRAGDVTVLDLKGRLRIGGSTVALHKTIRTLVQEEKTLLLINLEGVTYIDSCGLGELIAGNSTVLKKGGAMKLLKVTESLKELLKVTNLLNVFDIYESEPAALASFDSHELAVKKPQLFFV